MIAHFTFDSNYLDTSGNRNHAFEFGTPTFISDGAVAGEALSFDGIDDYLELPNIPELDFGISDFTLTFWYRVSGDQSGRPAIIGNKDWRSPTNSGWVVSSNYGSGSNGDDLAINLSDGITTLDGSKAVDVDFNIWHFVAVRVKRGYKMSLIRSNQGTYVLQEDMISPLTGSLSTNLKIRIGTSHQECGASFTKWTWMILPSGVGPFLQRKLRVFGWLDAREDIIYHMHLTLPMTEVPQDQQQSLQNMILKATSMTQPPIISLVH